MEKIPFSHRLSSWTEYGAPLLVRLLTGLLLLVLCGWMAVSIYRIAAELWMFYELDWLELSEHLIVQCLVVLALLELIRTLWSYILLGRVRVTFIIDTALVVLIGDLIGLWFKSYSAEKVLIVLVVVAVLVPARIVTMRYSPDA